MTTDSRARSIAVLGTASDVGKTVIVAGLCRLLHRRGVRVAPFKAQNMSLNSTVTAEGAEIARAQVLQAEACGIEPEASMNPVLLKPESDRRSQIVVRGKVWRTCDARSFFDAKTDLFPVIEQSYDRLARAFEVIVIEGAGSAAELNLRTHDVVNWRTVEMAGASVVLVADIDRGGVFAQVLGTLDLLTAAERARLVGVVVNKFRGDASLFDDGIEILESRGGVPVLGVVPFLRPLELDQEDGLDTELGGQASFRPDAVNVAVVLLPRMSNFTDFNALCAEPDVVLRYVKDANEVDQADVAILPGSKHTIGDLDYLRERKLDRALTAHAACGRELVGICGGYQMLGKEVSDPKGSEGGGRAGGLGLLDVRTEMAADKKTTRVIARPLTPTASPAATVSGYEIHSGFTRRGACGPRFRIMRRGKQTVDERDGAQSDDGLVWGTYIHGLFDDPTFRRGWLNDIRARKDLAAVDHAISERVSQRLGRSLDRWADHLERHLDLGPIMAALSENDGG